MLKIAREPGTDYLFAGLLDKALQKFTIDENVYLGVEPVYSNDYYFCQDYSFQHYPDYPKFVFYSLPSYREKHQEIMGDNCALVTYAADPEVHRPHPVEKIYDVGFIGKLYYDERNDYLNALNSKYKVYIGDNVEGKDLAANLSQCRVLFNHTRDTIDVNLRFFETMAIGCQLMIRNQWLGEFAKEDVHFMAYGSPEECLAKVDLLLGNDDLRNKITIASRSHFLANHTYQHRAISIINHIKESYARLYPQKN